MVADRSAALGEAVVANLKRNGESAAFVGLDVADEASVQNCVDFTVKTFGGLDCAVNAAGIAGPFVPANETPLGGWHEKMSIDLTGCLIFTKAVVNYWLTQERRTLRDDAELGLPPVTQRGALVNVASFNGLYASKNMVSHGTVCFLFTRTIVMLFLSGGKAWRQWNKQDVCIRVCYSRDQSGWNQKIRIPDIAYISQVNTVCPGVVLTPIMTGDEALFATVKDSYLQGQAM